MLAEYLPYKIPVNLNEMRMDRIMYGSDFPNIPYAWDREIKRLVEMQLSEEMLERVLYENAAEFFGITNNSGNQ